MERIGDLLYEWLEYCMGGGEVEMILINWKWGKSEKLDGVYIFDRGSRRRGGLKVRVPFLFLGPPVKK